MGQTLVRGVGNINIGNVTAGGEITAHGTVTAEVKGFTTAQVTAGWPIGVTGQVTAHGTITAQMAGGVMTALVSGANYHLGTITAGGQITAGGTVTAVVSNVVTAESRGLVTAVGTVTAEVKGFTTAQVTGGWPIGVTGQVTAHGTITAAFSLPLTAVVSGGWPIGVTGQVTATVPYATAWLLSGVSATGTGSGMDSRQFAIGFVQGNISGNSASATLLASYDSATWMAVTSWATGTVSVVAPFSAQLSQYYPYLAARVDFVSASGGVTAGVWLHMTRA